MSLKDSLLPEFDHEMATTRRVLARVPDADLGWKPHERSMSLGQLAGHVANLPLWCTITLEHTVFELDTISDDARLRQARSQSDLLKDFDGKDAAARAMLAVRTDQELLAPWTLKKSGQEMFTMPRISVLRSFVMNHLIHHRGQLTVYLRLRNVPLPPIYGPTADEQ
jgi:uncharacterized damage-inducible protein DinB